MREDRSPLFRTVLITAAVTLLVATILAPLPSRAGTDEERTLRVAILDLKPYGWEKPNGEKGGIVYQLLSELAVRTGMEHTIDVVPFARTLDMLKAGDVDLIISQPHEAALEAGERLAVMNQINVIAVTRKGSAVSNFDNLRGKRLLYIINTSYPELDGVPGHVIRVRNYKDMLSTIAERPTTTGGVFSEPAFYYWMHQLGYDRSDFGNIILISRRDDWIFVRNTLPDPIKEKIRKAVGEMQQDKVYEAIMDDFKEEMMHQGRQ